MSNGPAVNIAIRQVREVQGVSQRELARRLGVSQPVVARWEAGRDSPRLDTLQRIAEALEVNLEVIFSGRSPTPT